MKKNYERYIDYIVSDIQAPYFKNMENQYGLSPNEYGLVLPKVFNQPVIIKGRFETHYVYNNQGNIIYYEDSNGIWDKKEYDDQGKLIYYEASDGYWGKYEYDSQGNEIYYEDSDGEIEDNR
jgi:YD repeat-containing protein